MRPVRILLERGISLLVVLGSLMIAGCSASSQATGATPTPQATQTAQLIASSWASISLASLIDTDKEFLSYAVSPVDPETMYACTSDGNSPDQNPIRLWRTRDGGQHWSLLPVPASPGTGCALSIARAQPQRIAFLATNPYDNQRPCDLDVLYLSNDSGNSWQHISYSSIAPQGARSVYCAVTVTGHSLYLCYSFNGGQNSPQVSRLERTDNNGITWSRIDTAFGSEALFNPPQVGVDDTLAIRVMHLPPVPSATKAESSLWISRDAGNSWQQMGTLPLAGTFLLTPQQQNSSWPSSTAPFYALASEQIPSNLYYLQSLQSGNGQQWSAIPRLPAPGTNMKQPGLLQALAVTHDGRFLAFGINPKAGLPAHTANIQEPMPTFWLWIWNPRTSRWQVLSTPLNHPESESCGLCWDAQLSYSPNNATYLYVYHWDDDKEIFRVRLPDA